MNDEQRYKQGLEVRTEVLGEKHVNRSLENLNDFNQIFKILLVVLLGVKCGLVQAYHAIPVVWSRLPFCWHWAVKQNYVCIYVLVLTMV
jgi:hypothetical protein